MVPTEGQRDQVVPSSDARQSLNYARLDGSRLSRRYRNDCLCAGWQLICSLPPHAMRFARIRP